MSLLFEGRVALVTGGARGIGRAIALRLASEGADVAVGYFRNRDAAERTVDAIHDVGGRAITVKGHVGLREKVRDIVLQTADQLGPPTIVISNAASGVLRPLIEMDEKGWNWTQDVNCRALWLLARETFAFMKSAGEGAIVALSSLGAQRVLPAYGAVGVSKAGIEALVHYLAVELAPHITVNTVSAGVVDTDALTHFPNREELLQEAKARTPAGRMVEPEDVAGVVSFLCSREASMIRGQTITVDGGYGVVA